MNESRYLIDSVVLTATATSVIFDDIPYLDYQRMVFRGDVEADGGIYLRAIVSDSTSGMYSVVGGMTAVTSEQNTAYLPVAYHEVSAGGSAFTFVLPSRQGTRIVPFFQIDSVASRSAAVPSVYSVGGKTQGSTGHTLMPFKVEFYFNSGSFLAGSRIDLYGDRMTL